MRLRFGLAVAALALACVRVATAQEQPIGAGAWQFLRDGATLTGEWGGWRTALRDRGVDLSAVYTGDVIGVAHGGVHRRTEYLDNLDLLLTVDGERLGAWPGLGAFVYGVGNHGRSPSGNVGDLQAVDNIDATDAFTLIEAWLQQQWWDDRVSILAGLYDVNAEFDLLESATVFLNGSFGMGFELAQTGENGPSSYPATGLGVRLKVRPTDDAYAQLVATEGVPRDPDGTGGLDLHLGGGEGALLVMEGGWRRGVFDGDERPYAKIGAGGWLYTGDFDEIDPATPGARGDGNGGIYLLGEWTLWTEPDDRAQGLAVFGRAGWASPRFNRVGWFASAGGVYTGAIPGRDADALAAGFARTFDGPDFRRVRRATGARGGSETAVELTYAVQLLPWLQVQPDVQYVLDPGGEGTVADALVVGARFGVTF